MSPVVNAVNSGHICVTYYAKKHIQRDKDGFLIVREESKFEDSFVEKVIDYYGGDIQLKESKSDIFLNGLTTDNNSYPIYYLEDTSLYFQNGIFYINRAQDSATEAMYYLEQNLGGSSGQVCQPYGKM